MARQNNNRINAGSLVIATIVSLLIFLLCAAFILVGYSNRKMQQISDLDKSLRMSLESAINLVLADTAIYPDDERLELIDSDSVRIRRYLWGLYQVASIKVRNQTSQKEKQFEYGTTLPGSMKGCLYLVNHQRPLSLVGNTELNGNVFIPRQGLRPGYINQRGFDYQELARGKIDTSENFLPAINKEGLYYLNQITTISDSANKNVLPDSLFNSFENPIIKIVRKGIVRVANNTLRGHILIQSDTLIEVGSQGHLNDVILIAPDVKVQQGFKGNIQIFASDEVKIEEGCIFEYPSSIVLLKQNKNESQPQILIGKNCTINGTIMSIAKADDNFKTKVEINENSSISGILFVHGYLSLKSSVDGVVLTDFFIYKTPSTVYENHLVDVSLNRHSLSSYFICSSFFNSSVPRKIIRWLN